jgi:hypothetical protein
MLLALTVSVALAGGVNFNWGTLCFTEAPVAAKVFACNTNAGNWPMTASFVIDTPMPDFVGVEILMEGQSDAAALPEWWKLGASPDCRTGKAQFSCNFSLIANVCQDWTGGQAFVPPAGFTWDTNRAHVSASAALDASTPLAIDGGVEYYAGTLTIINSKVLGTGACAGCNLGMKWGLYSVVAAGLGGRRDLLTEPIPNGNHCLDWNNPVYPCIMPVPAHNTTWGQVKSLYR